MFCTAVMLVLGCLDQLLFGGSPTVYGVLFVPVCVLTAVWIRRGDLLTAPVVVPIAFAVGLFPVADGSNGLANRLVGIFTALATQAGWLYGGTPRRGPHRNGPKNPPAEPTATRVTPVVPRRPKSPRTRAARSSHTTRPAHSRSTAQATHSPRTAHATRSLRTARAARSRRTDSGHARAPPLSHTRVDSALTRPLRHPEPP